MKTSKCIYFYKWILFYKKKSIFKFSLEVSDLFELYMLDLISNNKNKFI